MNHFNVAEARPYPLFQKVCEHIHVTRDGHYNYMNPFCVS